MYKCLVIELPKTNYSSPFEAWVQAFPRQQIYLVQVGSGLVGWAAVGWGWVGNWWVAGGMCTRSQGGGGASAIATPQLHCILCLPICPPFTAALAPACPCLQYENITSRRTGYQVLHNIKR